MTAYYNEIDAHAAEWLRNLIEAGHIAPGDVDERDIRDVRPDEIRGYTQCHFFAGIGIWSHALRCAGWPDDRPVWTGSCPCQPFSASGRGKGVADERHLWPHWHHLIRECRPVEVFGEQVASKDGLVWLDLVSADMEATDYALGAVDTCAAGFGAPHIRQRLYLAAYDLRPRPARMADRRSFRRASWRNRDHGRDDRPEPQSAIETGDVADAARGGCRERGDAPQPGSGDAPCSMAEPGGRQRGGVADGSGCQPHGEAGGREQGAGGAEPDRAAGELVDTSCAGSQRHGGNGDNGNEPGRDNTLSARPVAETSGFGGLAHAYGRNTGAERQQRRGQHGQREANAGAGDGPAGPMPTNDRWAAADWLFCRDGKWRPVEPGTFPLAHGAPARMGRLRAYGNGLCAAQAEGFVIAYLDRDMVDLDATPAGDLFEWSS